MSLNAAVFHVICNVSELGVVVGVLWGCRAHPDMAAYFRGSCIVLFSRDKWDKIWSWLMIFWPIPASATLLFSQLIFLHPPGSRQMCSINIQTTCLTNMHEVKSVLHFACYILEPYQYTLLLADIRPWTAIGYRAEFCRYTPAIRAICQALGCRLLSCYNLY